MQTGQPFRAEVRFFSRDGDEVWILGEARLIRDEADRPAYFQGVAFDITITKRAQQAIAEAERATERARADADRVRADAIATRNSRLRQLNVELRSAKEAAEAAVQARTNFLTTMSHELRTPLNSVIVLAGLLAEGDLTATQQDMVRRMQLSSDHLLELINDVLEFSRLRAGQVELDSNPFDLQACLEDSLDIVAPRAAEKGLELRLAIGENVPRTLRSDQGRLRQVLLNLLGNAVKFTAEGFVAVRVSATPVAPGRWEFECAVADSGIGIKPEDAATLFEEFRQADSGIAREFGGTGLGLTICRRLCELLGGRIWVHDSAGPGATVSFTWVADADDSALRPALSLAARPSYAARAPDGAAATDRNFRPAAPGAGARAWSRVAPETTSELRVLVAEDNMMNQEVATLLLAAMGHAASVVANGAEAIAAVQGSPYDVVLMDIAMPVTDGITATRAIRGLGDAVHQPYIVALTAHAFPGDAEGCIEAGMDDYVAKPIDRSELRRALAAGADRAAARRRPAAGFTPATPMPGARSGGPGGFIGLTPAVTGPGLDFDPSVPRQLLTEFGPEPLRHLVTIFGSEASRLAAAASAAVAANDIAGAERAAHTLKSSAANLGAFALQSSCSRLESLARDRSLDGATVLTATIESQLADALGQLGEIVAPSGAS
jgi:signal transduction histidine kinase/HPt (histidine-containing phosphotransfer) domain-containing protein/ActR/RegA family two-component response regulator